MLEITVNDIKKEKGYYETCELAQTIFETLYDTDAQKTTSVEDFLQTMPKPLQVGIVLHDFLGPDSLEESISHITIEQSDPHKAAWWQEKMVWALEQVGRADVAQLVKQAISQYATDGKLDQEVENALSNIETHGGYDGSIYHSLALYIKIHAEEIVSPGYTEKSKKASTAPAHNTPKYEKEIKNKYSWFKL